MVSESRSDKRKERYREAKALGFSRTEATRLRDLSGKSLQREFSREARRISRKNIKDRSAAETFRLRRIQDRNASQDQIRLQSRLDSRRERWLKFSEWSKANKFPASQLKRIVNINTRNGLSPTDRFGYRMFYYLYVERLDDFDANQLADRGDSGMRYLLNQSLVPGRINLRRQINPPKSQSGAA
jgi:hypothetical protein